MGVRVPRPEVHCKNCGVLIEFASNVSAWRRRKRVFCSWKCRSGVHHGNWRGGRYEIAPGYVVVNTGVGKIRVEHRVVAEKALGRSLRRGETVHHINGNKKDSRNSNLLICTAAYHRWLHNEMSNRYAREHFS